MSDTEMEKNATASTVVLDVVEKGDHDRESTSQVDDDVKFDFLSYHEHNAGQLIVDPESVHSLSAYSARVLITNAQGSETRVR